MNGVNKENEGKKKQGRKSEERIIKRILGRILEGIKQHFQIADFTGVSGCR